MKYWEDGDYHPNMNYWRKKQESLKIKTTIFILNKTNHVVMLTPSQVHWLMMGVLWSMQHCSLIRRKCWCLQFHLVGMWGLVLENSLTTGMEDEPPFSLIKPPLCCQWQSCFAGSTLHVKLPCSVWTVSFIEIAAAQKSLQLKRYQCCRQTELHQDFQMANRY